MWNWEALLIFQNSTLTTPQFHSAPCVLVNSGSFNLVNTVTFLLSPGSKWKKNCKRQRGKNSFSAEKNVSFLRHEGVTSSPSGYLMENPGGKDQRGQILCLCLFISLSLPVRWGRLNVNNCILWRKPFLKFGEFCFFSSNRKEQILQNFQWLVSDKINRKIYFYQLNSGQTLSQIIKLKTKVFIINT